MTERYPGSEPDSEPEPAVTIINGSHEIFATRLNTQLYKHLGHAALFDHIFVETGDNSGMYIFRGDLHFDQVDAFMTAHKFPALINITDVSDFDRRVYMEHVTRDVADFTIPDDWTLDE